MRQIPVNPLVPRARCVILISGKERRWCLYPYEHATLCYNGGIQNCRSDNFVILLPFLLPTSYQFLTMINKFYNNLFFKFYYQLFSSLLPGSCLTLLRYCLNIFSRPFRSGLSTDMCISKRPGRNMALNQKN